jgi:hypothetical protein
MLLRERPDQVVLDAVDDAEPVHQLHNVRYVVQRPSF